MTVPKNDPAPTPDVAPEPPAAPEPTIEATPPVAPEASPEDELPEWARKELSRARSDAARYRTGLRDAESKLAEAKTSDEFLAATKELAEANAKLTREITVRDIAAKHGLPAALAVRLTGSTPEEMEADALELAKLIAPAPTSGPASGGLNPSEDQDDEMDPRKLAARYRRR